MPSAKSPHLNSLIVLRIVLLYIRSCLQRTTKRRPANFYEGKSWLFQKQELLKDNCVLRCAMAQSIACFCAFSYHRMIIIQEGIMRGRVLRLRGAFPYSVGCAIISLQILAHGGRNRTISVGRGGSVYGTNGQTLGLLPLT